MTTFAGYTAFVTDTENSRKAVRALAAAVPQLKALLDDHTEDLSGFDTQLTSPAFQTVAANAAMFTPGADTMPGNVPAEYQTAALETKNLRDNVVTRVFLPVADKNPAAVQDLMENRLEPLVRDLFGNDLLLTKTRTGASTTTFLPSRNKSLFNSAQQPAPAFKLRP